MYLLPPESRENPDKILMVYEVIGISTSTRIKKKLLYRKRVKF